MKCADNFSTNDTESLKSLVLDIIANIFKENKIFSPHLKNYLVTKCLKRCKIDFPEGNIDESTVKTHIFKISQPIIKKHQMLVLFINEISIDKLHLMCRSIPKHDIDDIVNQSFIDYIERLSENLEAEKRRSTEERRALMKVIFKRRMIDYWKNRKFISTEDINVEKIAPSKEMNKIDIDDFIEKSLEKISKSKKQAENYKKILNMHYFECKSISQIAIELGVSVSTISRRFNRVIEQIRKLEADND